jgi:hypothetical protein
VLTTGGGLYRYRLGDVVEVVGFHRRCPMLRFLGRSGAVSDLVGEKLDESFVAAALDRVLQSHGISPRFALLAPEEPATGGAMKGSGVFFGQQSHDMGRAGTEKDSRPLPASPRPLSAAPRYRLILQPAGEFPSERIRDSLCRELESALQANPHYRHAVLIGQLAPVELSILDPSGPSAWSIYERRRLAQGQKAGNIKPATLDSWTGWSDEFLSLFSRDGRTSASPSAPAQTP